MLKKVPLPTNIGRIIQLDKINMRFLFVDETGDPGDAKGSTPYFGFALLEVHSGKYSAIRHLMSQIRWLRGIFGDLDRLSPKRDDNVVANLIRGLSILTVNDIIKVSGIFINKERYEGQYLKWTDKDVKREEWAYYLRNYLLRHLLEFNFEDREMADNDEIDLILDRVMLNEGQRKNTIAYLNSKTEMRLERKFAIPPVKHLTVASSDYVCGLEIAHILADIVKQKAMSDMSEKYAELTQFIRIKELEGHKQKKEGH
jgi:hypothetical protein